MATTVRTLDVIYRFGHYEFESSIPELRKFGHRIKVEQKPLIVLGALLERRGEVVSRSELRNRLWPENIFVDFELGLNVAIRKLRGALGDYADKPKFIETVVGTGYRFIAKVECLGTRPAPAGMDLLLKVQASAGSSDDASQSADPPAVPVASGNAVGAALDIEVVNAHHARLSRSHIRSVWMAAISAIILAVLIGWVLSRRRPIPIHKQDLVLVTAIENRTGEAVLDGTLEFALQRDLAESEFVSLVTPVRVQDTLQLMNRPPSTALIPAVAREICLRDGGIRAMLTGRIEKFGERYLLTLVLVDPVGGATMRTWSQEAKSQNDLLPAVRHISDRLRRDIGEGIQRIEGPTETLEHVTTSSLRALQLYSQANQWMVHDQLRSAVARDLLQQAVALDPDFASAHNMLAWNLMRNGRRDEAAMHFNQAFTLSSASSYRERLFIQANYFAGMDELSFNGFRYPGLDNQEKAIAAYKELLAAYPDDYWSLGNLRRLYKYTDLVASAELAGRQSDARPNAADTAAVAAEYFAIIGPPDRAAVYARRAMSLLPPDGSDAALMRMLMKLLPSFPLLREGRAADADIFVQNQAASWNALNKDERDAFATLAGNIYLELGMAAKAGIWFEKLSLPSERMTGELFVAYYHGDRTGMESTARSMVSAQQFSKNSAFLLAQAGLRAQAKQAYLHLIRSDQNPEKDQCLEILREYEHAPTSQLTNFQCRPGWPLGLILSATALVAGELDRRGDFNDAIKILEPQTAMLMDIEHPGVDVAPRMLLAHIYRRARLTVDADAVEASLRKQLTFADQDHIVAQQLHIVTASLPVHQ